MIDFANPAAFWALLALPALFACKLAGNLRSGKIAARMASPRLAQGLLSLNSRTREWVSFGLHLTALAFFIIALARPQWGEVEEQTNAAGRSLIVGIDTSRSMLANDINPSRMIRAKLAAAELVKRLHGDRIGLMPFAGTAFMYAPITPDTGALLESIDALDTEFMPRGSSNLARAIDRALETFKKGDLSGQQALIIFTDGEELEGSTLEAAARARDARMAIICVAVGTTQGGLIPDLQSGGYYRDKDNKPVLTKLRKDVLVKIADLTGGLYVTLDGKGINDSRLDLILNKLKRSAMKTKVTKKAIDRYRWPLSLGLITLTAALLSSLAGRLSLRSAPALTAILLLFMGHSFTQPVAAQGPSITFEEVPATPEAEEKPAEVTDKAKPEEKPEAEPLVGDPWTFYNQGDWKNALFNFTRVVEEMDAEDPARAEMELARGNAAYKADEYDAAVDAYGAALTHGDTSLSEKAHYNLANAIYTRIKKSEETMASKTGKPRKISLKELDSMIRQLENSLEHYQETLVLNNEHAKARENHTLLTEFIKQLRDIREQKAKEDQGKQGGKKGKKKKGNKGNEGKGPKGQKGAGEGEGEGDGEGAGPGGKKKGDAEEGEGDEEGEGEGEGEEEGDGQGEGESEEDKAARESTNKDGEGDIGSGPDGKKGGKSPGGKDGKPTDENSEADNAVNPGTGYSRNSAIDALRKFSDEDMRRPLIEKSTDRRPLKDW